MWSDLLLSFCVAFFMLIVMRPIAIRIGLVDKPNYRKRHQGAIPLIGGIALFVGNFVYCLLQWQAMHYPSLYLLCIAILLVIGVVDDRYDISPLYRAVVQATIALMMIYVAQLKLDYLGEIIGPLELHLGNLSVLITVLVTIAVINAFNMIDGIDGLLGALASVSFIAMGIFLFSSGFIQLAFWCLALVIILLPYEMMNLQLFGKKYKIFMGDSGSTQIGFTMMWILLVGIKIPMHSINPIIALWLIAIPVIDMLTVMFRRLRKKQSPFKADRLHVHHIMQRIGLSPRQALFLITFLSALCATFGVLGHIYQLSEWIMSGLFVLLFFIYNFAIARAWRITRFIKRIQRRMLRKQQS